MDGSFLQIIRQISSSGLSDGQSISHESEPISAAIFEDKVLCPKVSQYLFIVQNASSIHSCHLPIDLIILIPRAAAARPHRTFHELLSIRIVLLSGVFAHLNAPITVNFFLSM